MKNKIIFGVLICSFFSFSVYAEEILSSMYYFDLAEEAVESCSASEEKPCNKKKAEYLSLALEQDDYWTKNFRSHFLCARGTAYMHTKEVQNAIDDFNNALALNDEWVKDHRSLVFFSRGTTYIMIKEYDKTIKDLTDAIAIEDKWTKDNLSQIIFYRGITYAHQEDFTKAMADFNDAYNLDDEWIKVKNNHDMVLSFLTKGYYSPYEDKVHNEL